MCVLLMVFRFVRCLVALMYMCFVNSVKLYEVFGSAKVCVFC